MRSRFEGEEVASAAEEPEEAAAPHAGAGKEPAEEAEDPAKICAYPPCDLPRIGICTRCLLVGWCSVAHQKAHWKAGHKAACAPAETRLVPVLSWEQRIMAEAKAAAPASLAATAKLAPIPYWDIIRDGTPPTAILKAWRKAAEGGHAVAQYRLGCCYNLGIGAALDYRLAVEWYTKAAAQGAAYAQANLALCYERGKGIAQDYKLAVVWYTRAAAQGYAAAQHTLGMFYERGVSVAKDFKVAADLYGKAAAQGIAEASVRRDSCIARQASVAGVIRPG